MILYFLRHVLAGSREVWQGDDARRPLTRALQTANIVAGALKMVKQLEQDERLARVDVTVTDPLQGDLLWLLPPKVMLL